MALYRAGKLSEAQSVYEGILQSKPDHSDALYLLGVIAFQTGKLSEALKKFDQAITIDPRNPLVHNSRGVCLNEMKRAEEAVASYEQALTLNLGYATAHYNLGLALKRLGRFEEALASYDRAIAANPDYAAAYYNRAILLHELRRHGEALTSYGQAISLRPGHAEAYLNRGNILRELGRLEEALADYDRALSIKPDLVGLEGQRFYAKMELCDWVEFEADCAHLLDKVKLGRASAPPFAFLAMPASSDEQLRCARSWMAAMSPPAAASVWRGESHEHDRIRVAYVSGDFRAHPASFLMAGMFEHHDRSRFEITGISFGADDRSEIRRRVSSAFERFVDVRTLSDEAVATRIRELEIDIAIDCMGFTTNSRTGIFAARPAPVAVNYLGYPGSMGAPYIDYIIADRLVIPEDQQAHYCEKVVYMPSSYLPNDNKRSISQRVFHREAVGLPSAGFVFCCFNRSYKITPTVFHCWMRILKRVEGGVLWLMVGTTGTADNLRREASGHGIDPKRLVFAERETVMADHLARHRAADLFLDTLPYNAHTTASDALWSGLPVLTCAGTTFAGRVGASLLHAIGLPELVTTSMDSYEQLAVHLATHPDELARIRKNLADNRLGAPLFDTAGFTRHIEAAYTAMYERHRMGLGPGSIAISADAEAAIGSRQ